MTEAVTARRRGPPIKVEAPDPRQLDAFEQPPPPKRGVGRPAFRTPEELQEAYNVRRRRYKERLEARAAEAMADSSDMNMALVRMTADAAARLDLAAGTLTEAAGGNAKALKEVLKSQAVVMQEMAALFKGKFPELLEQVEKRQAELLNAALRTAKR
jgi:hypothetical protein